MSGLKVRPITVTVLPRSPRATFDTLRARHRALAIVIDAQHRLDDPHVMILRDLDQHAGILWKAGAAETRRGMQEFRADAADGHGRFCDHHREPGERCIDLARSSLDIAQVGMAIAAPRRRADSDEHGVDFTDRRGQVGCETQPPGLGVRGHHRVETGLEIGISPCSNASILSASLVHAGDLRAA